MSQCIPAINRLKHVLRRISIQTPAIRYPEQLKYCDVADGFNRDKPRFAAAFCKNVFQI